MSPTGAETKEGHAAAIRMTTGVYTDDAEDLIFTVDVDGRCPTTRSIQQYFHRQLRKERAHDQEAFASSPVIRLF